MFRFDHANTKTFHHEPARRSRTRAEHRGFGLLGLHAGGRRGVAGRPSFGSCRIWRGAAVFRHPAGAGLAREPVLLLLRFECVATQDSDQE
jgi:hypothetical protein